MRRRDVILVLGAVTELASLAQSIFGIIAGNAGNLIGGIVVFLLVGVGLVVNYRELSPMNAKGLL